MDDEDEDEEKDEVKRMRIKMNDEGSGFFFSAKKVLGCRVYFLYFVFFKVGGGCEVELHVGYH